MAVKPDMVGIAVADMSASLAFCRLLGLPIPEGNESEAHVEVTANGYRIAWDSIDMLKTVYDTWVDKPVGHRMELAFKCDSRDEVDETYTRIVQAGYRGYKEPWDAFWGQRYAVVRDPDGNLISLFA